MPKEKRPTGCAYCYAELSKELLCGKCRKRKFCSKKCQVLDWKHGHKQWCGNIGELNFDYEIRQTTDGKGLGMFAMRDFKKNDKISFERPLFREPYIVSELIKAGKPIASLHPVNGSLHEKIERNEIDCGESTRDGLFITMSRINHDCLPNAFTYYSNVRGILILISSCAIEAGQEITIKYVDECSIVRKFLLQRRYGFECQCKVCKDKSLKMQLDYMFLLRRGISLFGNSGSLVECGKILKELIEAYDQVGKISAIEYIRLYVDFVCSTAQEEFIEAYHTMYLRKAIREMHEICQDDEDENILKFKHLLFLFG